MVFRTFAMAGGIAGALCVSQLPEFSQQYLQRLSGAVDELSVVVADFDRSADRAGLSRQAALDQMQGTAFLENRRTDMERTIARADRLALTLEQMTVADPLVRPFLMRDVELAQKTWASFKPAVPLTLTGLVAAAVGYFAGYWLFIVIAALLRAPFRRRRNA